jgi:hypothetical protein
MGSGSKRQKIKAFIRNPFPGSKKGKAASRGLCLLVYLRVMLRSCPIQMLTTIRRPLFRLLLPLIVSWTQHQLVPVHPGSSCPTSHFKVTRICIEHWHSILTESLVTGIQSTSGGGFFTNPSHFSVNNSVMMDNPTVHVHEASDRKSKGTRTITRIYCIHD